MPAAVGETPVAGRNQVDFEKEETEARGWLGHSLWGQVLGAAEVEVQYRVLFPVPFQLVGL